MTNPVSDADSEDSTDRVAEVTETWESAALTEPESVMDPSARAWQITVTLRLMRIARPSALRNDRISDAAMPLPIPSLTW